MWWCTLLNTFFFKHLQILQIGRKMFENKTKKIILKTDAEASTWHSSEVILKAKRKIGATKSVISLPERYVIQP